MDKIITTMLLTIAGVVCAMLVFNAVYPAVNRGGSAMVSAAEKINDRIKSQVSIIQAIGELNASGAWQDTNGDGDFDIFVWVKNVGAARIVDIRGSDVFLGQTGSYARIHHQDYAGGVKPYWNYGLENATEWITAATLKITIHYSSTLARGTYWVKVAIPNGVSDEQYFSM